MAAQVVRRIGRQSRAIELTAEGPVVPIPEAMAAAREAVRADAGARQLGREPDTITTAIVTLEYIGANGPQPYYMRLPVGQTPLGARGEGADAAIRVLQQAIQNRLGDHADPRERYRSEGRPQHPPVHECGPPLLARGIQGGCLDDVPSGSG